MTKKKAVIFDIGGVIITPPQSGIMKYGKSLGLPSNFLEGVMVMGGDDNAFRRMERGELTRTEFCSEYKKEVEKAAKEMNINLLSTFDPDILYENMGASCTVVLPMINAILALRKHGYTICILTNNSIDDTTALNNNSNRSFYSLLHLLKHISHHVIESCRVGIRKPSPDIYQLACDTMGIQPSEAVFLDDIGSNLKSAKKMGIQTIKVVDTTKALQDLKDATGINVFEEQFPPAVSPDKIVHSYVTTKAGHRIHYVDMGEGPVVLCVHGFPECWFAWRYQILPLVLAGYRVIVPDMLGYGDSSSPPEIEKYTQQQLCESIISLLDALSNYYIFGLLMLRIISCIPIGP
ncbi:bifunctional epoxide hydrolase 2-like [Saccoglossus kowalevskii]